MNVLIAFEESQEVCKAFRARGHKTYSCDLKPCSGGHPEWHLQMDAFEAISLKSWDRVIGFPPCTDLALSGAKHFEKKRENGSQEKSIRLFYEAWKKADCLENPKGIMNGGAYIQKWFPDLYKEMIKSAFPFKPDQIINPFDFGDAAQKPTCIWIRAQRLPLLKSTNMGDAPLFGSVLDNGEFHVTVGGNKLPKWYNLPPSENRGAIRSKTFSGIANAMAEQWG